MKESPLGVQLRPEDRRLVRADRLRRRRCRGAGASSTPASWPAACPRAGGSATRRRSSAREEQHRRLVLPHEGRAGRPGALRRAPAAIPSSTSRSSSSASPTRYATFGGNTSGVGSQSDGDMVARHDRSTRAASASSGSPARRTEFADIQGGPGARGTLRAGAHPWTTSQATRAPSRRQLRGAGGGRGRPLPRPRARLGRGATKEVYLAYDERLDREVALAIVVGAATGTAARRASCARRRSPAGSATTRTSSPSTTRASTTASPTSSCARCAAARWPTCSRASRPSVADAIRLGARDRRGARPRTCPRRRPPRRQARQRLARRRRQRGARRLRDRPPARRRAPDGRGRRRRHGPLPVARADPRRATIGPRATSTRSASRSTSWSTGSRRSRPDATQVLTQHLTATPVPPSQHGPRCRAARAS